MPLSSIILDTFTSNPYFSAGLGLFGLGTTAAISRQLTIHGLALMRRRYLISLEIPSKDKSYTWVLHWLNQLNKNTPPISQPWWKPKSHHLSLETTFTQHDQGASTTQFNIVPGIGTHWFQYSNVWMQITRTRDAKLIDLHNASPWESIQILTLRKNAHLFPLFLNHAKTHAMADRLNKTVIYTSYGPEWRPFGLPRNKRAFDSIVLPENLSLHILTDVRRFLANFKWYAERGIPYRRGYLMYGPPGSGKSSFIQALAGQLDYNICILNLSEKGLTDDRLNHLMTVLPNRSVLLLEDADAAFNRRVQTNESGYQSGVTFSGLLNALDGVAAAEERLIFMTTNHIDRLDPALIRPGRVDLKVLFDWPNPQQIRTLFTIFYGLEYTDLATMFVQEFESRLHLFLTSQHLHACHQRPSMASLQGHFISFRDQPEKALRAIGVLFGDDPKDLFIVDEIR